MSRWFPTITWRSEVLPRIVLLVAALAAAAGLAAAVLVSPPAQAGPPPAVTVLDAAALRDSGRSLAIELATVDGVPLVDPRAGGGAVAFRSLATSADGSRVAVSTGPPGQVGPLVLARSDGTQLEVALPGVRGASFEAEGGWLAVVDLAGALWRVDADTGEAIRVADGPFDLDPTVLPDGRILVLRLSAVDAPTWSAPEIVDPAGGTPVPVVAGPGPADQLVYGATALADGSIALVRHRRGGGLSVTLVSPHGAERQVHELDGGSSVAVSPEGEWLAWSEADGTWLAHPGDRRPLRIGPAGPARFSPDGSLLLLFGAGGSTVVDTTGHREADVGPLACWLGGGRGCRP
jgi:hypothetical protein